MSTTLLIHAKEVPGDNGLPLIGHTLEAVKDIRAFYDKSMSQHGPIFSSRFLGQQWIRFSGPDMAQYLLQDPDDVFSKKEGWGSFVEALFPRGLMLKDGAEHKHDRKIMQSAFNPESMSNYQLLLDNLMINGGVTASLAGSDTVDFHEFSKNLLAQLSSNVFLGENDPSQAIKLQKAFRDAVEATMAIVRKPWPGTKYNRGLVGRKTLEEYFASKVEDKRNSDSLCLFANLCNAVDESGNKFTNQQICDHMIFLMMAAQDTTSSALTSIIFALTEYPVWQERLRAEYSEFDSAADIDLTKLKETSWVFREALRMYTPGAIIPRRAKCDFEYEGYKIPAGTVVSIAPIHNHYDPEYWTQPETFDPLRFSPDRAEDKKHKFLFLPFSGGPAQCIGMHFAELEIKIILFHLLKGFKINRDTSKKVNWIKAPVWHPKNGLNVSFSKL